MLWFADRKIQQRKDILYILEVKELKHMQIALWYVDLLGLLHSFCS